MYIRRFFSIEQKNNGIFLYVVQNEHSGGAVRVYFYFFEIRGAQKNGTT